MPGNLDTLTNQQIKNALAAGSILSDRLFKEYRLNVLRQYKASLEEVRALINKMFEKYGSEIVLKDMTQYNRLKTLEDQIQIEIRNADKRFKKLNTEAIEKSFQLNYYHSGYAFESSLGIKLGFNLLSQKKIEAAILNPMDRITWIDRATAHGRYLNQQIKQEITKSLIQGEGYAKTAGKLSRQEALLTAVKEKFNSTAGKLVRVVQTETHRASVMGSLNATDKLQQAAEESGFKIVKRWIATLDSKTRDDHAALDGQIADEDGNFEVNGLTTQGPGLFGVAAEDINCRCDYLTEVQGYETKFRRDNETGKIIKWKNYNEWEKEKGISK